MQYSDTNYVRIFDTTLRDGEQSPGATMTSGEKLKVARALARLGVDIIEAGFPAASPDDLEAVRNIAATVGGQAGAELAPSTTPPIICGLARATTSDIETAWRAVEPAVRPRIHTFLATSDIHMKHKLRMNRAEVVSRVIDMVAHARSFCDDVEFSPEDAGRSDPEFLYQVLGEAIRAGATTLNIPDTVGYTTPDEFGALIAGIMAHTPGIERCVVSTHCHNDLGLATANSLAGIRAGARQVEVAVNGIGERAGNTSLEEIAMILHTRQQALGLGTGIDTTQIMHTSKLVSSCTGMAVQPNKAVVGANAFAHEAGIHQDGMLKHQETYEIMRPETVGASHSRLVLGKHSGRHAVKARLAELGYSMSQSSLDTLFSRFKELADKKKAITDADLEALASSGQYEREEVYSLEGLQVACGTIGMPTATVKLRGPNGVEEVRAAVGTGPVDATYRAIRDILGLDNTLLEFTVQSVTEGIDALGEVTVKVKGDSKAANPQYETRATRTYLGHGADTDIVVASAKAYLAALNKAILTHAPVARETATADQLMPDQIPQAQLDQGQNTQPRDKRAQA
ncbi:MAG: 2-isopropylmalate synthase [Proteobacteria bacterium]|nr:2-isopropylmalate synthase [Pseudomonadota bacterium]